MTHGQLAYILAIALTLIWARPPRQTCWALALNQAAILAALGAWDMGWLSASGSIIMIMLIDLSAAAYLAFSVPIVSAFFAATVPVYAVGLFAQLPRDTIFAIVTALAYGQLIAILGGYGGGGGLRDHIRRHRLGRGDFSRNLAGVACKQGAQE